MTAIGKRYHVRCRHCLALVPVSTYAALRAHEAQHIFADVFKRLDAALAKSREVSQ